MQEEVPPLEHLPLLLGVVELHSSCARQHQLWRQEAANLGKQSQVLNHQLLLLEHQGRAVVPQLLLLLLQL